MTRNIYVTHKSPCNFKIAFIRWHIFPLILRLCCNVRIDVFTVNSLAFEVPKSARSLGFLVYFVPRLDWILSVEPEEGEKQYIM